MSACGRDDLSAAGEVRAADVRQQLVVLDVGVLRQHDCGLGDFFQIVRRNLGRHAHRNAGCAVEQHHRQARGQHRRFLECAVVVGNEIHRAHVQLGQQQIGNRREPRLGVTHRRRVVAVARTEVALAIHQRIPHRKILRQPHHRLIRGRVAMRMVLTQHITDHARRLHMLVAMREAHAQHGEQDAALHGLLSVADFGQRAAFDHGDGVFEIGALGVIGDEDFVAVGELGERGEFALAGFGFGGGFSSGVSCGSFSFMVIRCWCCINVHFTVSPSPSQGEGWDGGESKLCHSSFYPHPNPPLLGEGIPFVLSLSKH